MRTGKPWLGLFSFLLFAWSMQAQPPTAADEATRRLAVDIFKQLIEINTTDSVGSVTRLRKRWRSAFAMRDFRRRHPCAGTELQ